MSTPYPRARIMAGPSTSAATVVDFMEPPLSIRLDTPVELGSPSLAFDEMGDAVEASRKVTVPLYIQGAQQDVGRAMQSVARAISLPDRWLMLQRRPGSDPVWYRIRPQSPGTLDLSRAFPAYVDPDWSWELTLTVDSTAVGERRAIPRRGFDTVTSSITNNGVDRGITIDPPGEAPAPLRVDVRPDMNMNGRRIMVSTFSVPWDSPLLGSSGRPAIIHEDTQFSATTGNSTRTTGAGHLSGMSALTVPLDSYGIKWVTSSGLNSWRPEPGRYLVMARLYREGGSGQANVRLGQRWLGSTSWQPWRTFRPLAGGSRASWLPLGYLQHPFGDSGAGLHPSEIMPPTIGIQSQATELSTQGAVLHLDQVAFVPVDLARGAGERACFAQFAAGIGFGGDFSFRVDSEHRRVAVYDHAGNMHAVPQPERTGGWPVAVPGMATCVSVFLDTTDAPVGIDTVAVTSQLRVDAAPRLLHLGQE